MRSDPVASCTNSRRQATLRPISMSTAAWSGAHFRTIVVRQSWRKQPHTSELISSLRGACTRTDGCVSLFRFRPFQSLRVHLCPGVNSSTRGPTRAPIGERLVVQRARGVRWPRRVGTRKSAGRKTTEEKTAAADTIFSC